MGVGLQPLEFTECLTDSPQFRDNLQKHEKELERTSQQIKRLIKEVKDIVQAAKRLSAAQLALATSMEQLQFSCIGASLTEDELVMSGCLADLARLIRTVEDERERMLGNAHDQIIQPLEKFRKDHIGAVKEGKKKFDKKTAKFCQTQERTLGLSARKQDNVFQEADAALDMAERDFCQASLEYVFLLQAVQERKKFELVETLLGFVFGWWTFYHQAHEVHSEAQPIARDLQIRIQRTRGNFEETSKQTESLMKKMMEMRQMNKDEECGREEGVSRAGYVLLQEKKAFGSTWSKHYAAYDADSNMLALTPYNQINVKTAGAVESVSVSGARRTSEAERRFCWEAVPVDRERVPLLLQALSEADRAAWLRAIENTYAQGAPTSARAITESGEGGGGAPSGEGCYLDESGFMFVRRCIALIEARGLEEQGLYRVAGVSSKVSRLVSCASDPRKLTAALREEPETRTLTSALKSFLRALPDSLLPAASHASFLRAAKLDAPTRLPALHSLVHSLPQPNFEMLDLVLRHLHNVVSKSDKNLMSASNLAVCFGPTLMRPPRETVASILELKFCNVLVETLLDHYELIFHTPPPPPPLPAPVTNGHVLAPTVPGPPRPEHIRGAYCERPITTVAIANRGVTGELSRYTAPHQHMLRQLSTPPPPHLHTTALRGVAGRSSSSSAESVCSSASPPPAPAPYRTLRYSRVRTLYACLGESEGELSFEPNQVIENVTSSAEPGWLQGTLHGRCGLVPENYVEPIRERSPRN